MDRFTEKYNLNDTRIENLSLMMIKEIKSVIFKHLMMKIQDPNVFTGESYQILKKEKMLTYVPLPESRKRFSN